MEVTRDYTLTTIGASSVTLTPVAGQLVTLMGDPNILGNLSATQVLGTTGTPSAGFWKQTGVRYRIIVQRLS